jgi:serine protease Do
MSRRVLAFLPAVSLLLAPAAGGAATAERRVTTADVELARSLNRAFADVAERAAASVVIVRVTPRADAAGEEDADGLMEFFHREFRRRQEERGETVPELPRRNFRRPAEQGSGVIFRADGYIITNHHVVENADTVEVELRDGRKLKAEVRGSDPESDIAVLKVDAGGLPAAPFGDSARVRVGEFAIAVGAPFQLDYSVTIGHVSGKGRRVLNDVQMMDQDFLQTDASINPGNSGGPLMNLEGEVIGINSMIRGMNTGIGFAVPVSLAREVAERLIADGKFTRSWLGIGIANLPDVRADLDLEAVPVPAGVVVTGIQGGGPSAGSDLRRADVIVSVDGREVATVLDLKREIRLKKPGRPVTLAVYRGKERLDLQVAPGELPAERLAGFGPRPPREPGGDAPEAPAGETRPAAAALGLTVRELPRGLAERLGVEEDLGVLITAVADDSPAARARLEPGEVITKINREPVRSLRQFDEALAEADLDNGVAVTVVGDEGRRFEILRPR